MAASRKKVARPSKRMRKHKTTRNVKRDVVRATAHQAAVVLHIEISAKNRLGLTPIMASWTRLMVTSNICPMFLASLTHSRLHCRRWRCPVIHSFIHLLRPWHICFNISYHHYVAHPLCRPSWEGKPARLASRARSTTRAWSRYLRS